MTDVYLWGWRTISVESDKENVFYLDLEKLWKTIDENPDKKIFAWASTDWFWTAQEINKEKFDDIKKWFCQSLLLYSSWDHFSIDIEWDRQDCTVLVPKKYDEIVSLPYFLQWIWKIEFWLSWVYKILRCDNYKIVSDFSNEVKLIIKKYTEIIENNKKYNKT